MGIHWKLESMSGGTPAFRYYLAVSKFPNAMQVGDMRHCQVTALLRCVGLVVDKFLKCLEGHQRSVIT